MFKRLLVSILVVVSVVSMTACKKHEHIFKEATCDKPKTCEDCGYEEGEALGHTLTEADCENPKTCTTCGYKDGEALGHTVTLGECERCNKFQGQELMDSIAADFKESSELLIEACETYMEYAYSAANRAVTLTNGTLKKAEKVLRSMAEKCNKEPLLSDLVVAIDDILKEYPTVDKVSNDEEWKAYYECIKAVNMKNANFSVVYLRLQMKFIGPNLKE